MTFNRGTAIVLTFASLITVNWEAKADMTILGLDPQVQTQEKASFTDFSGTASLYDARCPPNSFVTAIQVFRESGDIRSYIFGLRYSCKSKIDGSVVIRKTDPAIPNSVIWQPYSPSEPLDGAIAKCDDGSSIVAIQGYKYGDANYTSPLAALGYICQNPSSGLTNNKRTDAVITDTLQHPAGFSGTGRPTCPSGTFVTSIQAYRYTPSGKTINPPIQVWSLSELRFACTSTGGW